MGQQRLRDSPALADLTHHILGWHADVTELHLVKAVMVINRDNRIDLNPLALHIDQDKGDAFLLFA